MAVKILLTGTKYDEEAISSLKEKLIDNIPGENAKLKDIIDFILSYEVLMALWIRGAPRGIDKIVIKNGEVRVRPEQGKAYTTNGFYVLKETVKAFSRYYNEITFYEAISSGYSIINPKKKTEIKSFSRIITKEGISVITNSFKLDPEVIFDFLDSKFGKELTRPIIATIKVNTHSVSADVKTFVTEKLTWKESFWSVNTMLGKKRIYYLTETKLTERVLNSVTPIVIKSLGMNKKLLKELAMKIAKEKASDYKVYII